MLEAMTLHAPVCVKVTIDPLRLHAEPECEISMVSVPVAVAVYDPPMRGGFGGDEEKLMVCGALATLNKRVTVPAARYRESPPCVEVSVQVPAPVHERVLPDLEQAPLAVTDTARPELEDGE